jgi:DNA-binding response OmpR family regulator
MDVLIVDDEDDIRLMLSRVLQREGFTVAQAADWGGRARARSPRSIRSRSTSSCSTSACRA